MTSPYSASRIPEEPHGVSEPEPHHRAPYFTIFWILVILTAVTVLVAQHRFTHEIIKVLLALAVASLKASCVSRRCRRASGASLRPAGPARRRQPLGECQRNLRLPRPQWQREDHAVPHSLDADPAAARDSAHRRSKRRHRPGRRAQADRRRLSIPQSRQA